MSTPVVQAQGLSQTYRIRRGWGQPPVLLKAVDGVSFSIEAGRTLAVVGESGCGKSTLARMVTRIEEPSSGELHLLGQATAGASAATRAEQRRAVQLVFQNPYGSLNPRQTIGQILEAPLRINTPLSAAQRQAQVSEILRQVGLRPEHQARYPHMFSGGQRQRIAIARALMLRPALLVADEPVSALDVSVQAQILNLLTDLQQELGLAYLFISHDLSVVRHIAHEVMVMYLGQVMEQGPKARIFARPLHPYTQALLASTPVIHPVERRSGIRLQGELPSPLNPPSGCVLSGRCPHAKALCAEQRPELRRIDDRQVSCHFAETFLQTTPS